MSEAHAFVDLRACLAAAAELRAVAEGSCSGLPIEVASGACDPGLGSRGLNHAAGRRRNRREIGRGRGRRSSGGARCSAQAGMATPCLFRSLDVAGFRVMRRYGTREGLHTRGSS